MIEANYIPIMLSLSGRKVIVFGGGHAAFNKVRNMISQAESVTVISPEFSHEFSSIEVERITMKIDDPEITDTLIGSDDVVIIATDDPIVNGLIAEHCRKKCILFNKVDDAGSPFIFPATLHENGVTVSVSTHGRSPSLSRFIRDRIRENMTLYFSSLDVVEKLRKDLSVEDYHQKAAFFRELFSMEDFWDLISVGKFEDAYRLGMSISASFEKSRTNRTDL